MATCMLCFCRLHLHRALRGGWQNRMGSNRRGLVSAGHAGESPVFKILRGFQKGLSIWRHTARVDWQPDSSQVCQNLRGYKNLPWLACTAPDSVCASPARGSPSRKEFPASSSSRESWLGLVVFAGPTLGCRGGGAKTRARQKAWCASRAETFLCRPPRSW